MQRPARSVNGYKSWASRYRNSKTESRKQKLENRNRSANGYKSWASNTETRKHPERATETPLRHTWENSTLQLGRTANCGGKQERVSREHHIRNKISSQFSHNRNTMKVSENSISHGIKSLLLVQSHQKSLFNEFNFIFAQRFFTISIHLR